MKPRTRVLILCGVLTALVAGVFLQAAGFGFVFDDRVYITDNTPIHQGLSATGVRWAFSGVRMAFWHPLTWLSHMLDVSLYGMNPAGHHLSAIVLHAANAVACFLVLRACTGATWPAAVAAALFAIHPLRAESVAYVSERKDVLSVLFWFLTMASWRRYLSRPSTGWYLASVGVFTLGLTAKPMLITLPFVLLLLDYWPFGRARSFDARTAGRLLLEKAPFFVLAIAASVMAYVAQLSYGSLSPVVPFGLGLRLLNAIFSYGSYFGKLVWPFGLGAFYPHPGPDLPVSALLASAAVLAAVSLFAAAKLRRRPFVIVGWLWFLGTLVPVIGLVQLGDMGMADRFTYLPSVGLSILIAWGGAAWVAGGGRRPAIARGVLVAWAAALVILTFRQVGFWRDGVSLFSHTVAVTGINPLARYNLAVSLTLAGRRQEAVRELRRIIGEDPDYVPAYHDLGTLLFEAGQTREAVGVLSTGLERFPRSYRLHYRLGLVFSELGATEVAASRFEEALRLRPQYVDAHVELGVLRGNQGRFDEAERHFQEALSLDPASEPARWNLDHLQQIRGGSPRSRP